MSTGDGRRSSRLAGVQPHAGLPDNRGATRKNNPAQRQDGEGEAGDKAVTKLQQHIVASARMRMLKNTVNAHKLEVQ